MRLVFCGLVIVGLALCGTSYRVKSANEEQLSHRSSETLPAQIKSSRHQLPACKLLPEASTHQCDLLFGRANDGHVPSMFESYRLFAGHIGELANSKHSFSADEIAKLQFMDSTAQIYLTKAAKGGDTQAALTLAITLYEGLTVLRSPEVLIRQPDYFEAFVWGYAYELQTGQDAWLTLIDEKLISAKLKENGLDLEDAREAARARYQSYLRPQGSNSH